MVSSTCASQLFGDSKTARSTPKLWIRKKYSGLTEAVPVRYFASNSQVKLAQIGEVPPKAMAKAMAGVTEARRPATDREMDHPGGGPEDPPFPLGRLYFPNLPE